MFRVDCYLYLACFPGIILYLMFHIRSSTFVVCDNIGAPTWLFDW